MLQYPVYAIIILFLGSFLTALTGKRSNICKKIIVLASTGASFILTILMYGQVMLNGKIIPYWMGNWIPVSDYAIGIGLEIDSLSLFFGIIMSFIILLSGIYSFKYMESDNGLDKYYSIFLLLSGSVMGLIFSGDLFNMYVMIEIMTFSAVGLTAFRNHNATAVEAGYKYLVIGSLGSSLTLLGTVLIYTQLHTLNLAQIAANFAAYSKTGQHPLILWFAIALLMGGYAVKAFIVPCHIVAPDAYMAAPSSISMLFSGVVNKAGVYGILRLMFVVFQSMGLTGMQLLMVFLGTITMFVGVTLALYQNDFKRLLAFHSISQVGYIITGIGLYTSLGVTGGLYHTLNHSLFKGLLFLCAGAVLYSTGTTDLNKLGGLSKKMPFTSTLFLVGAFSISGIPPFNGFASKWMIFQASYEKAIETNNIAYGLVTVIALLVSIMTLASFIKVTQSVFFGQLKEEYINVKEVPISMKIPMMIMGICCFISGILPQAVNQYLIRPTALAVLNIKDYINVMMGEGYAERIVHGSIEETAVNYSVAGYNPISWLILFITLLAAFGILVLIGGFRPVFHSEASRYIAAAIDEPKNDNYYCGEKSVHSHVGGKDLFWGFKHNFKGYFRVMEKVHSGKINDYVLLVITSTAFFILSIFLITVF